MDFLDSLNLDVSHKRSRRVRSWYLYEQFKSLEHNQLRASQKLKDKSYQDRILRQELSERKARRQLFDQFGLSQSESKIKRSTRSESAKTANSVSTDDFYESFCEFQDVRLANLTDAASETCSHEHLCGDDYTTVDEPKEDISYAGSVNSVVNINSDETITLELQKGIDEPTVVDEMNLYFDEVKNNLERIEQLTELDLDDKVFEKDSLYSIDENASPPIVMLDKNVATTCDYNILAIWSKLVSFAYQLVQLNHGNCYVDYGSQFLTAVLACDVLRRGINKMCHVLQRFVSPIKFVDDWDSSTDMYISATRKKTIQPYQSKYTNTPEKVHKSSSFTRHQVVRKYQSENCWQNRTSCPSENRRQEQKDRASEPLRNSRKFLLKSGESSDPKKSSYSSIWPDFSNDESTDNFLKEGCKYSSKVLNPMLKLSQYFDSVLKEIDDSMI